MLSVAEQKAAVPAAPTTIFGNYAVSIKPRFDAIAAFADLIVPVRRPAKRYPSREVEQEYADALAAKNALSDVSGTASYDDLRQELGLND